VSIGSGGNGEGEGEGVSESGGECEGEGVIESVGEGEGVSEGEESGGEGERECKGEGATVPALVRRARSVAGETRESASGSRIQASVHHSEGIE
jgi:hypothetical protein